MFDKLLVPLDGSQLAEQALDIAHALLPAGDGDIILLRVPELSPMSRGGFGGGLDWWYPDQAEDRARQDAADYLDQVASRWARPGVTFWPEIGAGDPAGEIVDRARAREVDAIVMSTHGRSGLTRWTMGSVAEKVMRGAPCPVLVAREARPLRHIIVPLDGSPVAEHALPEALAVAQRTGAPITLLHVVEPYVALTPATLGWEHLSMQLDEQATAAQHGHAADYLGAVAERHRRPGLTIRTLLRTGPIADAILQAAAETGGDLIAMATHGRTGLRRWVYGSVTEKVMRGARCCLLVVRVPEEMLSDERERTVEDEAAP
jgi:nucleotide-binding universal stress UspA family protein